MALTPAEKMRRYRARLKEKDGNEPPLPTPRYPRDLIRAFDEASASAKLALVQHVAAVLLRAASDANRPAPPDETTKPPHDARQIDLEDAIAAATPPNGGDAVEHRQPVAAPPSATPSKARKEWQGDMPAANLREAKAQGIDDAALAALWEKAKTEKGWLVGKALVSNVARDFRRWLNRANVSTE